MALSKTAIEQLAVDAVRDEITRTEYLAPYISENDKEPSWDGNVYIYKNNSCAKDQLIGRIPVQVKGTSKTDFSKKDISFQMSVADLNNYLTDGGIILFVVYVSKDGTKKKIYYAELTPIKLREILKDVNPDGKKSVRLKQFPHENRKKVRIFKSCHATCKRQAGFASAKLFSLEELEKQGILEGITIPVITVDGEDPQTALFNSEVYAYARIKGSDVLHPIGGVLQDIVTEEVEDVCISIDGEPYYSNIRRVRTKEATKVILGESFTITFFEEKNGLQMDYKGSSKFRVIAKDLDFMLNFLKKRHFEYNGMEIEFPAKHADMSNFDIEKQQDVLHQAKEIVNLLDKLHCEEDLDSKGLAKADFRRLSMLINGIVHKKKLNGFKDNLALVHKVEVGNLQFAIHFQKVNGEPGAYYIHDFFDTELAVHFETESKEKVEISQFFILKKDDLACLSNIQYNLLVPSFQKTQRHPDALNRANWFLLEVLLAYDECKKQELLDVAQQMSEWLLESTEEELAYQIKMLNHLQIIRRKRELTKEEKRTIYEIIDSSSKYKETLIGANLLLGQQNAAEMYFDRLTLEEQETFKAYPIYHFWNYGEE